MNKRVFASVAFVVLFATACATTDGGSVTEATAATKATEVGNDKGEPPEVRQTVQVYDKSKPSKSKMHCTSYMPTGSHRKRTRCISTEQKQLEEDAARNTLMKTNRSSLGRGGEGGEPGGRQ